MWAEVTSHHSIPRKIPTHPLKKKKTQKEPKREEQQPHYLKYILTSHIKPAGYNIPVPLPWVGIEMGMRMVKSRKAEIIRITRREKMIN